MTRGQLVKKINKAICGKATGLFRDDFWFGHSIVLGALYSVEGIEIKDASNRYSETADGTPDGKTWSYTVTDGKHDVYVTIRAAGAGTVADPLSCYDIVAYAT